MPAVPQNAAPGEKGVPSDQSGAGKQDAGGVVWGPLLPSPPTAPWDAPLSLQLGLKGLPPLETDCLLLLSI